MKTAEVKLFDKYYTITLSESRYPNGRLAIMANCVNGEPFGKITVNLPDEPLEEGEFFVKTYSENVWVPQLLGRAWFIDTGNIILGPYDCVFRIWKKGPQYPGV